jgi:hypothetical protein
LLRRVQTDCLYLKGPRLGRRMNTLPPSLSNFLKKLNKY